MVYELLLLEDVFKTGRKGDVIKVKPGFARNFLIPKKKAVIADKRTLRMREQLTEERAKQAILDKEDSEKFALVINEKVCSTEVKVDDLGHMYGSVSAKEIAHILKEEGIQIDRHFVNLPHPIKKIGEYRIVLNLKEGVNASFLLKVLPDRVLEVKVEEPTPEPEPASEEEKEEEKIEEEEEKKE